MKIPPEVRQPSIVAVHIVGKAPVVPMSLLTAISDPFGPSKPVSEPPGFWPEPYLRDVVEHPRSQPIQKPQRRGGRRNQPVLFEGAKPRRVWRNMRPRR